MKLLLDTNFLMIPGQFRVDIYEQMRGFGKPELYTADLVVSELEKLAKGKGKDGANARLALMLVKENNVKILKSGKAGSTDEAIRRIATREGMSICTADKRLKTELVRRNIPIISLRKKKYLVMED